MLNEKARKKIVSARKRNHMTQEVAAARANMDKHALQRIENGERKAIDLDLIEQIAEGWHIDYVELLPLPDSYHSPAQDHGLSEEQKAHYQAIIRDKDDTIAALKALVLQQQKMLDQHSAGRRDR